jgi:hypothetical protein
VHGTHSSIDTGYNNRHLLLIKFEVYGTPYISYLPSLSITLTNIALFKSTRSMVPTRLSGEMKRLEIDKYRLKLGIERIEILKPSQSVI